MLNGLNRISSSAGQGKQSRNAAQQPEPTTNEVCHVELDITMRPRVSFKSALGSPGLGRSPSPIHFVQRTIFCFVHSTACPLALPCLSEGDNRCRRRGSRHESTPKHQSLCSECEKQPQAMLFPYKLTTEANVVVILCVNASSLRLPRNATAASHCFTGASSLRWSPWRHCPSPPPAP